MSALKSIVKRTAMATDRIVAPPAGITVLIYHRVGAGTDSDVDLPVAVFERQLAHLAEHHRVLSLDAAVAELSAAIATGWASHPTAADLPTTSDVPTDRRRPVVITFDDGTSDFTEYAVPALARHGLPATLYVATQFVEDRTDFPWGAPPTSWSALRDAMADADITVGSHTHSHWLMDRLDPALVDDDLDRSIDLVRDRLDTEPLHFAYPKAVVGAPKAEIAVRRRFRSAALANSRVNRVGRTDLHRLWRTPIQRSDDPTVFERKADGGLRLEGEIRTLAARARYRGAQR